MADARYAGFLPGKHAIEGYGAGGFHFGGMSHRGSILALPSGIHAWGAVGADDISIESLAPLFAEVQGAIEFLLVGTGMELVPLKRSLRERLRGAGIRAEPMPTAAAARTYSVLLAEDRRVAAALIAVP
ncbi:MAG TPA: Mth938-like domain-containing protein [Methylovirgula sp.]|nr:Mth938-like domain-containing protein [Methylovirgula sp.]